MAEHKSSNEDVEFTPEVLRAGADILEEWARNSGGYYEMEAVKRIYLAMKEKLDHPQKTSQASPDEARMSDERYP